MATLAAVMTAAVVTLMVTPIMAGGDGDTNGSSGGDGYSDGGIVGNGESNGEYG
jgi:hypothetical protein